MIADINLLMLFIVYVYADIVLICQQEIIE